MGAGGGLGGPAHTDVNFGGKKTNLGAAPHDWGFAKNRVTYGPNPVKVPSNRCN